MAKGISGFAAKMAAARAGKQNNGKSLASGGSLPPVTAPKGHAAALKKHFGMKK